MESNHHRPAGAPSEWAVQDSNLQPVVCRTTALTIELTTLVFQVIDAPHDQMKQFNVANFKDACPIRQLTDTLLLTGPVEPTDEEMLDILGSELIESGQPPRFNLVLRQSVLLVVTDMESDSVA